MDRTPVVLAWSGGKDSALALSALQSDQRYDVVGLLTTVVEPGDFVSMHRVPASVIRAQSATVELPLSEAKIVEQAANAVYESAMSKSLQPWRTAGVRTIAFGDLFLDDIRAYRDRQFVDLGMECVYPLWGRDTAMLAEEFIDSGFRAVTCCVDARKLTARFCGRSFDSGFLRELPQGVDPCGENGEFHTLVIDGPGFRRPVHVASGDVVQRGPFWYCDLTLGPSSAPVTCA